ncbi:MAG: Asp23/Gls24 family envelope stress response protein [bacterium]|nr:Asp23/Gls24 family envelope stress response protein [bacterium]
MRKESRENTGANNEKELGETKIHNDVIATIAGIALAEVKGISSPSGGFVEGITGIIGRKYCEKGIKVEFAEDSIILEIPVIVEYGVRIPETALEIQKKIKERVERLTGNNVKSVNICVQGIKLPGDSKKEG